MENAEFHRTEKTKPGTVRLHLELADYTAAMTEAMETLRAVGNLQYKDGCAAGRGSIAREGSRDMFCFGTGRKH